MAARSLLLLTLSLWAGTAFGVPVEPMLVEPRAGYGALPGLPNTYKLHKELFRWGPAAQKCQDEMAHLVVLNTPMEAQTILSLFSQVPNPGPGKQDLLHVGIYDSFTEGVWHVITGGLLTDQDYNMWAPAKPSTSTTINCGAINRGMQFTDVACDSATYLLPFICEREAPVTTAEPTTTVVSPPPHAAL